MISKLKYPNYKNIIPKNKKYLLEITKLGPDDYEKNFKYLFEINIPLYYESVLEKLAFELKKNFKSNFKIQTLKQRYPNSCIIFVTKEKENIKKFIVNYLKFINNSSFKESLHYPDLVCLNSKIRN